MTPMPTVLITGASSGIGRATAQLFQEKGWNVVATMRSPEKAKDWGTSDRLHLLRLDVTDLTTIKEAIQETLARCGGLDVLVNNAGYGLVGPFEASTSDQVDKQFATNVTGLMNVTREVLPHFRQQRSGTIINVSSMGGLLTFPFYSLYHATKWAVEGFSEALVYELDPFNIRVKLIEPGPIKTDFYDRSMDVMTKSGLADYEAAVAKAMTRLNNAGTTAPGPEIVAKTIFRAASDGKRRLRYPVNAGGILTLRRLVPVSWYMALIKRMILK
jgi:NAD(P)-dependent dehydrogenase (short-subunit alcohol dehydrogenase family)